jgi:hypothetical protein
MRQRTSSRPARQLCLICVLTEGLVVQVEHDLEAGQLEAVREGLRRIRAQISGVREEAVAGGTPEA